MSLIAVLMVKDEEDVLDHLLAHLIGQGVDRVVVADNLSTDKTPDILERWANTARRDVRKDDEPGYYQDSKMTALTHTCGAKPGDWMLPLDADEWWYPTEGTLGELLPTVPVDVLKVWGWNHYPHGTDDTSNPNPFTRMQWREPHQQTLPKVWFRYHPDAVLHMGNHEVDMPGRREHATGAIEFRHMGIRSLAQFIRKARNGAAGMKASTVNPMHCSHWREWGEKSDQELATLYDEFCTLATVYDPAPE